MSCSDYARKVIEETSNHIGDPNHEFLMNQGFLQLFGEFCDELKKIRVLLEHMTGGAVVEVGDAETKE